MRLGALRSLSIAAVLLTWVHCVPAFAQEQNNPPTPPAAVDGSSAPVAPRTPPTPSQSTTKRVWTNEDMGDIHRNSSISTFSGSATKPTKPGEKATPAATSRDAKRYQDQIAALRAKLPPLDDKISKLQAVLNGNTVTETRSAGGAHIDDWHEELVKLQKQRDDVELKISSLQDEARHNGVPENQIPQ
jgi:hypothetical protein